MPVFEETAFDLRSGGAGNVYSNLQALGCAVESSCAAFNPSQKHRYLVGHHLLLRVDLDRWCCPDRESILLAQRRLRDGRFHALVLSDYNKGWLSAPMCQALIEQAREIGIPVIVDPKTHFWHFYRGATVICPNSAELTTYCRAEGPVDMSVFPIIVEKAGAQGLMLHYPGKVTLSFRPRRRPVFDVTGAGDTVIAVIAAVLAAGGDLETALPLANLAAGHVIGQVGTATCPLSVLEDLIREENAAQAVQGTGG